MRPSLKLKAAAAITLLFLAMMAVIASVQTRFIRADVVEAIREQQTGLVTRVATRVDERLRTNLLALTQEALAIPADVAANPQSFQRYIEAQPAMLLLFDALVVISPAGEMLAGSPPVPGRRGMNVADREYVRRGVATARPLISEPYLERATGHPSITMLAPIFDTDGRVTAFLGGQLDLLKPNLLGSLATAGVGKTGYFFVINKSQPSVYVIHRDASLVLTPSTGNGAGALSANEFALSGREGTIEATDATGAPALYSYRPLTGVDWILATNYPLSEGLAPVYAAEHRAWAIAAVLALLLAPLIWLLTWYLITPLLRLQEDVRALRRGTGAVAPALLSRQDEIGELARDFAALIAERQEGAEALRRSTQLLDNIVENIPVAIQLKAVADDFRFVMWNKAAEAMHGLPRERALGRTVLETWSSEDIRRFRESDHEAVAANGLEFARRATATVHRGTIIAHTRKVPLLDEAGVTTHLLVIAEDITERVESEARLARSEARFRGAADSALDAFFVLDAVRDASGDIRDFCFRHLNANAERMVSRQAADVVGRLLCEVFPTERSDGHFAKYVELVRTGVAIDEEFAVDAQGVAARWLHHQVVRVDDGIAITARDISARRAADEELRSSRAFLRSLIDNLPVAIYVKDVRPESFGRMVVWNTGAEVASGISEAQALGRTDAEIFHPALYRDIEAHDTALLASPMVCDTPEHPYRRADGTRIHLHTRSVPLFGEGEQPEFILRISEDVTAQREAARALAASERRLRTIADHTPACIAYLYPQEIYRFTNAAFERAFGVTHEGVQGRTVRDIIGEAAYAEAAPHMRRARAGETVTFERQQQLADGVHWIEATYIPEIDADSGAVVGFHALLTDITARKHEERRLLRLSQVDGLTGLANRIGFEQRLSDAMARSEASGQPLAVMYLDVDHFKQINDTYGHAAGDALLRAFAHRLRDSLRKSDLVARLGGDEFVAVMERVSEPEIAARLARQALHEMLRPFDLDDAGTALSITASIGVAFFDGGPRTAAELVAEADAMLYAAKRSGRNNVSIASWPGPVRTAELQLH